MSEHRIPKYTDPIRFPQYAAQSTRNLRGWVLLVLTIVLPGSVQSLFGNRVLARFGLVLTLATWAVVAVAGLAVLLRRSLAFTLATNPIILTVLTVWLLVFAVTWIVCLLDTLRRIRIVGLTPRTRTGVLAGALVSVLVIGGGLAWGTVTANSQRQLMSEIFASGFAKRAVDGRYNIALLGSDAGDGRDGIRPDSISVVSIDAQTGHSIMIGLPRNMQNVPFSEDSPLREQYPNGYDCGDECLINAIYQLGEENADLYDTSAAPAGAQAMKEAVGGVTGLEIQYYAMIDLKGFESLIDAMGGIDVVAGKRVPVSSPIDPSTGKHGPVREWIEPGEQHLDGYHALWFARSREFSSDYERMVRQRCVQEAMLSQLDPATVLVRYQAIAQAAPDVVSTDIPQLQVNSFVDLAIKAQAAEIDSLNLTPPTVEPAHPDYAAVHGLVAEAIAELDEEESSDGSSDGSEAAGGAGAVPPVQRAAAVVPGAGGSSLTSLVDAAAGEGAETDAPEDGDRAICYVP